MIKILLAGRYEAALADLEASLVKSNVELVRSDSGRNGLSMVDEKEFDLVITDENLGDMSGIDFISKVVSKKPMINSAAISSLSPVDFHEAGEGLGILMQLPVGPSAADAAKLLDHLSTILNMMPNK